VIEDQVGAGGMAVVFRARDEVLGRLAAIKVLAPALTADQEFRARFLRESRAAALVEEPHIIPVYGAGEAGGMLYIATRYVAGGDLAALLVNNQGPLSPERAAALVVQVASALDAAHRAGLVHRDVKPGNVLVDRVPGQDEHAYLSDFGITKGISSETALTAAGQLMGTPDYCAPEQIRGEQVDGRADQYALACVAFVLLTGVPPFRRAEAVATLFAHLKDPIPAATGIRPDLPKALDPVLARALAKDPQDRYASCGEFAAELRHAVAPASAGPARVASQPAEPEARGVAAEAVTDRASRLGGAGERAMHPVTWDGLREQALGTRQELAEAIDAAQRRLEETAAREVASAQASPQPLLPAEPPAGTWPTAGSGYRDGSTGTFHASAFSWPRRGKRRLAWTALIVLAVLLASGGYAGWLYNQSQYYVGVSDGQVAIFRGSNQSLAGISLSTLFSTSTLPADQLGSSDRALLGQTIAQSSYDNARQLIAYLQGQANTCYAQWQRVAAWATANTKYQADRAAARQAKGKYKGKLPNPGMKPTAPNAANCGRAAAFGISTVAPKTTP
jgi:serine/threonine-protein kinase